MKTYSTSGFVAGFLDCFLAIFFCCRCWLDACEAGKGSLEEIFKKNIILLLGGTFERLYTLSQ